MKSGHRDRSASCQRSDPSSTPSIAMSGVAASATAPRQEAAPPTSRPARPPPPATPPRSFPRTCGTSTSPARRWPRPPRSRCAPCSRAPLRTALDRPPSGYRRDPRSGAPRPGLPACPAGAGNTGNLRNSANGTPVRVELAGIRLPRSIDLHDGGAGHAGAVRAGLRRSKQGAAPWWCKPLKSTGTPAGNCSRKRSFNRVIHGLCGWLSGTCLAVTNIRYRIALKYPSREAGGVVRRRHQHVSRRAVAVGTSPDLGTALPEREAGSGGELCECTQTKRRVGRLAGARGLAVAPRRTDRHDHVHQRFERTLRGPHRRRALARPETDPGDAG